MPSSNLNPYLQFAGQAREAMTYYQEVFGGELNFMTFGDTGSQEDFKDQIMHGQLETPSGFVLMGADLPAVMGELPDSAGRITVALSGDDVEGLKGYFEKLSEGGTVQWELQKQVWGDYYGQVVDKYGIPWMANISGQAVEAADSGS